MIWRPRVRGSGVVVVTLVFLVVIVIVTVVHGIVREVIQRLGGDVEQLLPNPGAALLVVL